MKQYLEVSEFIDWDSDLIMMKAKELSFYEDGHIGIAKKCFEFVRDEIKHSWDYQLNPVTCKASDVLLHKTGFCYAKSHLLAALLRANGIPSGLCYQRLTIANDTPPYCIHGLNAIWLNNYGWYRVDARGNKAGVNAQFDPPIERLAFSIAVKGEADFPEIWSKPLEIVVDVLKRSHNYNEVADNLPDIQIIG